MTNPVRTAFDLARWAGNRTESVVALDALANAGRFDPADVLALRARYPRARGGPGLPAAVVLADGRSGSPPETRMRLALVDAGLPPPEVQWVGTRPGSSRWSGPR